MTTVRRATITASNVGNAIGLVAVALGWAWDWEVLIGLGAAICLLCGVSVLAACIVAHQRRSTP